MSIQNKLIVPKLRFLEFKKHWVIESLGDIVDIKSGNSPSLFKLKKNGTYPFVKVEDLNNCEKYQKYSREYTEKGNGLISEGSVIFPKRGAAILNNKIRLVSNPLFMDSNMMAITLKTDKICAEFLYQSIKREKISKIADTSTIPQINNKHILPYKICIPDSNKESQKIADFLSKIDTKATQLTKKHLLLKKYKKGVMQQLFNNRIKFKNEFGEQFQEWEYKKLSDIFIRITKKNTNNNQNILTISAQKGLINQLKYFNKSVSAKDVTGYYLLDKGDFAYNKSYSAGYPMGAIKRLNNYDKGVVSTLYICFRIKSWYYSDFYEQYLDNGYINHAIHKIAQEGARNHGLLNVSVSEFFNDIYVVVPSYDEQKKIAEFLKDIDKKITLVETQLEQAKTFKQGLLEQMFV